MTGHTFMYPERIKPVDHKELEIVHNVATRHFQLPVVKPIERPLTMSEISEKSSKSADIIQFPQAKDLGNSAVKQIILAS